MPRPGVNFAVMSPKVIGCLLAALALPALACEMPDEGNMPMRRAVTRVQMLKEVDAWAEQEGLEPPFAGDDLGPAGEHGPGGVVRALVADHAHPGTQRSPAGQDGCAGIAGRACDHSEDAPAVLVGARCRHRPQAGGRGEPLDGGLG